MKRLIPLVVTVFFFVVAATSAFGSFPLDLSDKREWIEAKFGEEAEAPRIKRIGIEVVDNHGPVQRNAAHQGASIRIGSTIYERGLYTHADSELIVRLPGKGKSFSAKVGVLFSPLVGPGYGSVRFNVEAGDQTLFRSEILRSGAEPVPVEVALNDATEFTLRVDDADDGINTDQAQWAEPTVLLEDGTTIKLEEMLIRDPRNLKQLTPDAPFSFIYGGKPSAEFLDSWTQTRTTRQIDDRRTERTLTYTDPDTGLEVRCISVDYLDFPTVEWTLYFKNTGKADTPILEKIQAIDTLFPWSDERKITLHHSVGSPGSREDFRPLEEELSPNREKRLYAVGGKSSQLFMPYYSVDAGTQGVILAIGWPGEWDSTIRNVGGHGLQVRAGQMKTHFKLFPDEEVRTPRIVLQFWGGRPIDGQNVWRRWMFEHNLRKPKEGLEKLLTTHACTSDFFDEMVKADTASQLFFIDGFVEERLNIDYWWMDAGWYPCGEHWGTTGTWEVDQKRFPNGLREVSDHAKKYGIKTIVWFEPERVREGSWLAENKPEWLLKGPRDSLLYLGNPDALAWLIDHIDAMIKREGIDYYRQDLNMGLEGYFYENDAPDRQGMTENKHICGFLAYWDALLERNPDLLIDTCAGGGRRIDVETLRRAVPLHRSDYMRDLDSNQCQSYGLALWVPVFGCGSAFDAYTMRSALSPCVTFAFEMRTEHRNLDYAREHFAVRERTKKYWLGDYYPLSVYSLDPTHWIAWQYHLPKENEGMVQVFRREKSEYVSANYKLQGLDTRLDYRVEDIDAGVVGIFPGKVLSEAGLPVTLKERRSAGIFLYAPIEVPPQ